MNWYTQALKKYTDFSGRARRSEYWFFWAVSTIISVVCIVLDLMLGTYSEAMEMGLFSGIYLLLVLLPSLAVLARRLHDTGRSGWWMLIQFIPVIGVIAILVFTISDSERGRNKYGENPKGVN